MIAKSSLAAFCGKGVSDVLKDVVHRSGLSPEAILSRARTGEIVEVRRELARRLRERGLSYPQIGALLGRDHSTVLALLRQTHRTGAPRRARCVGCRAPYQDHQARPPHALPARACAGFQGLRPLEYREAG